MIHVMRKSDLRQMQTPQSLTKLHKCAVWLENGQFAQAIICSRPAEKAKCDSNV